MLLVGQLLMITLIAIALLATCLVAATNKHYMRATAAEVPLIQFDSDPNLEYVLLLPIASEDAGDALML